MRMIIGALAALALSGCFMTPYGRQRNGNGGYAQQPNNSGASSSTESDPANTSSGANGPSAAHGSANTNAPHAMVPTSIEVHSDCPRTLPLFIGDKPKFGSGTKTSIGSNTTTTFPRRHDGTASVWIIDDSENGIARGSVSPETRRLTIGRSCTDIVEN